MKNIVLLMLVIAFQSCNSQKKRKNIGDTSFQKEMNAKFKDATTTPLTKKGLKNFKGLAFFKFDEKYKVNAKLIKTPDAPTFNFPTTTDRVAVYVKYGIVSFSIDGKKFNLSIYKELNPKLQYMNHLFLPFFDATNGKSTYKGGRFIDVLTTDITEKGTLVVDFNKAYNPYCAYNSKYSCPITPRDNYIDIEVKAGVKAYVN